MKRVNRKRKNRLAMACFLLIGVGASLVALFGALDQNLNMFYPPKDVVSGVARLKPISGREAWLRKARWHEMKIA